MFLMNEADLREAGLRLVDWYARHARDLPWRVDPSPYRVLVSEFMLQQTVVGTVLGYFDRWMERFPDVRTLAGASEQEVLAIWQGLGYYRRASNLLRASHMIVAEFEGRVPERRGDLLRLPGVGPYIADAVLSFAFGRDVVTVDANVARVFMRLRCLAGRGTETAVRRQVREWATAALPLGRSSDFNQAVMDFGSTICRPRSPLCEECFLAEFCAARRQGRQYDIPTPQPRKLKKISTAVAIMRRDGCVYIQQRPPGGLFAGMWEFPGGKLLEGETPAQAVVRECREELGITVTPGRELLELVHYYTVFEVTLHAIPCAPATDPVEDDTHRWVPLADIESYPMPSANARIIERLRRERP